MKPQFPLWAVSLACAAACAPSHAYDVLTHLAVRAVEHTVERAIIPANVQKVKQQGSFKDGSGVAPSNLPAAAGGFASCRDTFANGAIPVVNAPNARALCFDGFAVLYSPERKTPIYSAEKLTRARIADAKGEQRTENFFEDARLPASERSYLNDYRGSGFDRGHTSPAGDMPTPDSMAQSFSLANMVPQAPENNRGAWADIEKATRKYVQRSSGNVYVITGPHYESGNCPFVLNAQRALQAKGLPLPASAPEVVSVAASRAGYKPPYRYDAQQCTIGASKVAVPSHLFKLVYDANTGKSWAHWLQNVDWAQPSAPISYEELVRRTGIDFLPGKQI